MTQSGRDRRLSVQEPRATWGTLFRRKNGQAPRVSGLLAQVPSIQLIRCGRFPDFGTTQRTMLFTHPAPFFRLDPGLARLAASPEKRHGAPTDPHWGGRVSGKLDNSYGLPVGRNRRLKKTAVFPPIWGK